MIDPKMIPDEVLESTAWAMCDDINGEGAWDETPFRHRPMWRSAARAAIAAALNAWPGGQVRLSMFTPQEEIILPVPQDKVND
jgi:hypothetical protein